MFLQELDLLEIRLNTLAPVVDRFGIVEVDRTHTGRPKPFVLQEHLDRFSDFPIQYLPLSVPPNVVAQGPLALEAWQRRQLQRLVWDCADDDTVIVSDLDEIPDPAGIRAGCFRLRLDLYYFHLNTRLSSGGSLKPYTMLGWQAKAEDLHKFRHEPKTYQVIDGGWHFSSVGIWEDVREKMQSTIHTECGTPEGLAQVERQYLGLRSTHGESLEVVSDDQLPPYVQANRERFAHLFWEAPCP